MDKRIITTIWLGVVRLTVAILVSLTLLTSCSSDESGPDPKIHYIDMDCTIVEKIPVVGIMNRQSKAFLIRSVKDTTLYSEFIGIDDYVMPDSVYYNHEVGDTLHFDYILKNRFFKK